MEEVDIKEDENQATRNDEAPDVGGQHTKEVPEIAEQKRSSTIDQKLSDRASEYTLIQYLSTLVKKRNVVESLDFDFVEFLLENGANINNCNVIGESAFHIVAKYWNIDVARFLLDHGADINAQDYFGRSPLHEACALNYSDMVEFLLQNGANIDIKTYHQKLRPIHFAAKNDSSQCLTKLLAYGADINSLDNKSRTPLQLAAEMNRANTALLLINEGASATIYDNEGNSALTLLAEKMPDVAVQAMDQLYSSDNVNRKEFFSLNYLEGANINEGRATTARTPLEIGVQKRYFSIVMHPVVQRLIDLKWEHYGKAGAIWNLMLNLGYAILWTILSLTLGHRARDMYLPLGSKWWLLCIVIIIVIMTGHEIKKQIKDTLQFRQQEKDWIDWRARSLEEDIGYCYPEEWKYLVEEVKSVRNHSTYFNNADRWFYFDWLALLLVITTIITHIVFLKTDGNIAYKTHRCILIMFLLVIWIRIAKFARPFQSTGPIVVIFSHIIKDIIKCSFLFAILFIPYSCAFWLTFGPFSQGPVIGYDNFGDLFHSMLCMVVGVDFPFEDLLSEDPFMARLLCSSFIISTAIIVVNLLIALLSDTFTRLYSNAVANAIMQRAQSILQIEKTMSKKLKQEYYKFVRENCSPQVVSMDFKSSHQPKTEKEDEMGQILNEIKSLQTVVASLQGKCSLTQVEVSSSASISELLRQNHENTTKINKILNILAAKKQTDSNSSDYIFSKQDISSHCVKQCHETGFSKGFQPSVTTSNLRNTENKRSRFSSLGEVNGSFEDSEFTDTCTPRGNDMAIHTMRHSRPTLRSSSTVSIPALNIRECRTRESIFARRLIHLNRKESHCSAGSISL